MNYDKTKKLCQHIFVYMSIGLILLLFLVPLSYVFITALKTPMDFLREPLSFKFSPTFENFKIAWEEASLGTYLFNSIFYTVVATVVSLLCSLLLAYPIAREYIPFAKKLYTFLLLGMFLPNGAIMLFRMLVGVGLYNTRLGYIMSLITIGGFPTMFLTAQIKAIPKELDEAAVIDGCGYFRYFFSVIIPLAKPAIATTAMLVAIPIWNNISKAVMYLSDNRLYPVARGVYSFAGAYTTDWTSMSAAVVIVSMPLLILYLLLQRYIVTGLSAGSVKS